MFPVKDRPLFYAHVNTIRDIDTFHDNNFDNITVAHRFFYDEDIHIMYLNKLLDLEYSKFYNTYQDMLSHHIAHLHNTHM